MALFLGVMLAFALIGCDTGTNGGGGGLSQAEKDAAKAAALEDYAADPEGFADFVASMNDLKGWSLPPNPNTWSASQWEQYYSFIDEYQGGNGNGNGNGNNGDGNDDGNTGWPGSSVLAEWGLSGMTAPAGAANINYSVATVGGRSLTINFTGSSVNDAPINTWLTGNGWTRSGDSSYGGITAYTYTKTGFIQASYIRNGATCQIQVAKQ
jgi:hypothetical protein